MQPRALSHTQQRTMERMVRRNEKALLRVALEEARSSAQGQPIESDALYLAACHKQGAGVARMLVDNGVVMGSDKPLRVALQRGLADVGVIMSKALPQLSDIEFDAVKTDHPLHVAARMGLREVLGTLFEVPCKQAWDRHNRPANAALKASHLLRSMARVPHDPQVSEPQVRDTVDFLLERGADVEFSHKDAFGMVGRAPIIFQAAVSANLPVMRALVAAGADARRVLQPEERNCPQPYPTVPACVLHGICETFEQNKKKLLPMQLDMLDYLASLGLGCELWPNDCLPRWISDEDVKRIERTVEHAQLVGATIETTHQRAKARL